MAWEGSKRRDELREIKNIRGETWEKIRVRILKRDEYKCQMIRQGRKCLLKATDVDHIEAGNNHEDSNLQSLCSICHKRKTSAEVKEKYKRDNRRPQEKHWGLL